MMVTCPLVYARINIFNLVNRLPYFNVAFPVLPYDYYDEFSKTPRGK